MAKVFEMSDRWDDEDQSYTAIKMNVIDDGSDENSRLLDLSINGGNVFFVDRTGMVRAEIYNNLPAEIMISGSPENKELIVQEDVFKFRMPFEMHIQEVRVFLSRGPSGANLEGTIHIGEIDFYIFVVDGQDGQIQNGLDMEIANDGLISLDLTGVGSNYAGSGLKITLIGRRLINGD
jgi:hypothetical protein